MWHRGVFRIVLEKGSSLLSVFLFLFFAGRFDMVGFLA
jgi:hypothetical protein